MNPTSAAGPDHLSPRLLQFLALTSVSPEAGVTGLSALTRLVQRLVSGDLPDRTVPLLAASTLIPLQPHPDKIRPIAVRQALRRLVTNVLLPAVIDDTRDRLSPGQLANVVPSGMDAIVHDFRMLMRRHGRDPITSSFPLTPATHSTLSPDKPCCVVHQFRPRLWHDF